MAMCNGVEVLAHVVVVILQYLSEISTLYTLNPTMSYVNYISLKRGGE